MIYCFLKVQFRSGLFEFFHLDLTQSNLSLHDSEFFNFGQMKCFVHILLILVIYYFLDILPQTSLPFHSYFT